MKNLRRVARLLVVALIGGAVAVSVAGCQILAGLGGGFGPNDPFEPVPATSHPNATPLIGGLGSPISREEALAVAHAAAPRWGADDVLGVVHGTWADLRHDGAPLQVWPELASWEAVWRVDLGINPGPMMGSGTILVIRAQDGVVLQQVEWIS